MVAQLPTGDLKVPLDLGSQNHPTSQVSWRAYQQVVMLLSKQAMRWEWELQCNVVIETKVMRWTNETRAGWLHLQRVLPAA